MAKKLIEAENISKYYRLGVLGSRSLKEDLKHWWAGNLKKSLEPTDPESRREIWALRDINFFVQQGEVLGLIGKKRRGEVNLIENHIKDYPANNRQDFRKRKNCESFGSRNGLSWRTNRTGKYLPEWEYNGNEEKEIDRKFDEIIEFSGVSRFLDTPVKRYSSGMYVRLAFSVAAHLDPEILVIDEVLAVGDAEFQQKCMTKIKSISKEEGKTILFVSHNIQTIRNVCNRALVLDKGKIVALGDTESVLSTYAKLSRDQLLGNDFSEQAVLPGNDNIRIVRVELIPKYLNQFHVIDIRTDLSIRFEFIYQAEEAGDLMVILQVFKNSGELIFELASPDYTFKNGRVKGESAIPGNFLNDGLYYISLAFVKNSSTRLFYYESCLSFDVEDYKDSDSNYGKWSGIVRPAFPLNLTQEQ